MKRLYDSFSEDGDIEEVHSPGCSLIKFEERSIVWEGVSEDFVPPSFETRIVSESNPSSANPFPPHQPREVKAHSTTVRGFEHPSYYRRLIMRTKDPIVNSLASALLWLSNHYVVLTRLPGSSITDIDHLSNQAKFLHIELVSLLHTNSLQHVPSVEDCSHMSDVELRLEYHRSKLLQVYDLLNDEDISLAVSAMIRDPDNFLSILNSLVYPSITITSDGDDNFDSDIYDYSDEI